MLFEQIITFELLLRSFLLHSRWWKDAATSISSSQVFVWYLNNNWTCCILFLLIMCVSFSLNFWYLHQCATITNLRGNEGEKQSNCVIKLENGIEPFVIRYQSESNRLICMEMCTESAESNRSNLQLNYTRNDVTGNGGIEPHKLESTVMICKLRRMSRKNLCRNFLWCKDDIRCRRLSRILTGIEPVELMMCWRCSPSNVLISCYDVISIVVL
jgi:hypothetical protein